jgi:hypothetical protein
MIKIKKTKLQLLKTVSTGESHEWWKEGYRVYRAGVRRQ